MDSQLPEEIRLFIYMMTPKIKKRLTILASSSIALFSLIACITGVFAWFYSKKAEQVNGNHIEIRHGEDVVLDGYTIYEYDFDNDYPVVTDKFPLHGYDCFIETKNEFNKKYVVVDFSYPHGIAETKPLKIGLEAPTNNYFESDKIKVQKQISNLIQFKFLDNTDGSIVMKERTPTQIYEDCREAFFDVNEYDLFVDSTIYVEGEENKSNILNDSIILTQSSVACTGQIIIEYTYNYALIETYKNRSGVDYDITFFKSTTVVNFAGDITSISFGS